jgi:hypothetical protein
MSVLRTWLPTLGRRCARVERLSMALQGAVLLALPHRQVLAVQAVRLQVEGELARLDRHVTSVDDVERTEFVRTYGPV